MRFTARRRRAGAAGVLLAMALPGVAAAQAVPDTLPRRAWPLYLLVLAESRRQGVEEWAPYVGAQIDVESAWDPRASSLHAEGLAQFTEATAGDAVGWCDGVGEFADWRVPEWQVRAMVCYLRLIRRRWTRGAASERDRWAMKWHGYNAGPGWLRREREAAADRTRWESISAGCLRARQHCEETRRYVRRIRDLLPTYRGAPQEVRTPPP